MSDESSPFNPKTDIYISYISQDQVLLDELLAAYAPEENPVEAIWLQLKTLLIKGDELSVKPQEIGQDNKECKSLAFPKLLHPFQ